MTVMDACMHLAIALVHRITCNAYDAALVKVYSSNILVFYQDRFIVEKANIL